MVVYGKHISVDHMPTAIHGPQDTSFHLACSMVTRADKGWAVKRARPSKKV